MLKKIFSIILILAIIIIFLDGSNQKKEKKINGNNLNVNNDKKNKNIIKKKKVNFFFVVLLIFLILFVILALLLFFYFLKKNQDSLVNNEKKTDFLDAAEITQKNIKYNNDVIKSNTYFSNCITLNEKEDPLVRKLKNNESICFNQIKKFSNNNDHLQCRIVETVNFCDRPDLDEETKKKLFDYLRLERDFMTSFLQIYIELINFFYYKEKYENRSFSLINFIMSFMKVEDLKKKQKEIFIEIKKVLENLEGSLLIIIEDISKVFGIELKKEDDFYFSINNKLKKILDYKKPNFFADNAEIITQEYIKNKKTFFDDWKRLYEIREVERKKIYSFFEEKNLFFLSSKEEKISFSDEEEFFKNANEAEKSFFVREKEKLEKIFHTMIKD